MVEAEPVWFFSFAHEPDGIGCESCMAPFSTSVRFNCIVTAEPGILTFMFT